MLGTRTGLNQVALRLGNPGSGLGYEDINISQDERLLRSKDISLGSFAVEFDTWYSGNARNEGDGTNASGWDPQGGAAGTGTGAYHMGLDVNGSTVSVQRNQQVGVRDDALPDIYGPAGIHVRVLYDHGAVTAWTRSNAKRDEVEPLTLVLDREIEPIELGSPQAIVGFTAGTGDATSTMEVDNLVVRDLLAEKPSVRGDANADGAINISDAIFTLNFLFVGGPHPLCLEATNSNDDKSIDITDGIFLLNYLFLGGPPPTPNGPAPTFCGVDPPGSPSRLGCEAYAHCAAGQGAEFSR